MTRSASHQKQRVTDSFAIYISTTLDDWKTMRGDCFARDTVITGVPFRRLDPLYFAWLRDRMIRAEARFKQGKISPEAFDVLSMRFRWVKKWATDFFDEVELNRAIQTFDPTGYQPPQFKGDDYFQGILALPEEQRDWPTGLRDIWTEIACDLINRGIGSREAQTVAQGIVEGLVGTHPGMPPEKAPVQSVLPF